MKQYEEIKPYTLSLNLEYDRTISHLALLQKYRPQHIAVQQTGDAMPPKLMGFLEQAGGGIFQFDV